MDHLWVELHTLSCSSLLLSSRKRASRDGNITGKVLNLVFIGVKALSSSGRGSPLGLIRWTLFRTSPGSHHLKGFFLETDAMWVWSSLEVDQILGRPVRRTAQTNSRLALGRINHLLPSSPSLSSPPSDSSCLVLLFLFWAGIDASAGKEDKKTSCAVPPPPSGPGHTGLQCLANCFQKGRLVTYLRSGLAHQEIDSEVWFGARA